MDRVRREAALSGRNPTFQPFDPPDPRGSRGRSLGPGVGHPRPGCGSIAATLLRPKRQSVGSTRLLQAAAEAEVHDTCLWTSLAVATGAQGNSTALVGTPETVAKALLEYYKLGAPAC